MTKEVAKKLLDCGFPKEKCEMVYTGRLVEATSDIDGSPLGLMVSEYFFAPSLSELIEACGDRFTLITGVDGKWLATKYTGHNERNAGEGDTPEEAVANLWLKIAGKEKKNT